MFSKTHLNGLLLAVVLINLCAVIGCHRGYYRRQADAEARRLILEKANDPRWESSDGTIEIDPQSRMFDPFSADHPPIPPDDAASHQFMRVVDEKEGYPHWHANGDTNYVENPVWKNYLPVDENGRVVLTLERAYQLALIHSPDLQQQRETLYLSALDVSLERFGFDTTGIGVIQPNLTTRRGSTTFGSTGEGARVRLERLGITGANFAIGLANTILFNFGGGETATSIIDFSIIQPLLRGAGRDRIMESLTQAERTLLANVRQLARFRRGFYLEIAIGRGSAAGLNRGGTFLGIPNSATLNAGGFLGLLEQQQRIRNQELNVRQLEFVLELFREFFLRDRLDAVQLKSFESNVYRQQRNLLDLITSYQTSLDRFKLDLGLPPDLDVMIDDSFLDRFELVSDQVNERLISIGKLREQTGTALNKIDDLFDDLAVEDLDTEKFQWPTEVTELIGELIPFLDQAKSTLEKITREDRRELESDIQKLESKLNERKIYLENLKAAIKSGQIPSNVDPGLFELDTTLTPVKLRQTLSDPNSPDSILNKAAKVMSALESIKSKINQFSQTDRGLTRKEAHKYILEEFQEKIPGQLTEMNNLVLEMSLTQARARSNSIQLAEVEIESPQTIEIARCMRRDWMNARASLVDNFRNIEFVADELETQFDLLLNGNMTNEGDNQLRAGFRLDAPIDRMSERNQYRQALIDYQQTQRQFYQFEDNVKRNLRDIVRNLNRNKVLFELDRRTVQVEIENVEINRYKLDEPVGPGATSKALGATTAQNLTSAIIGLNNAQNSFLGSWVEFEVLRRSLDFDMGTMQLDAVGQWIDPGKIDAGIGQRAASMMGIQLDCQFCQGVVDPLATPFDTGQSIYQATPSQFDVAPPQPQFESDSVIEPIPESQNEVEELFVPTTPLLNKPETGMQQQNPNSLVPRLLFNQIKVSPGAQTKATATSVSPSQQLQTRQQSRTGKIQPTLNPQPVVPPESVVETWPAKTSLALAKVASPADQPSTSNHSSDPASRDPNPFLDMMESLKPADFQIQPLASMKTGTFESANSFTLISAPPEIPLVNRISDQFADRVAIQVSRSAVAPGIETRKSAQPAAFEAKSDSGGGSLYIMRADPGAVRASPGKSAKPTMPALSPRIPNVFDPADWQSRPSSLGGILNRFRTVPQTGQEN